MYNAFICIIKGNGMFDRYYETKNILVGKAELVYSIHNNGWMLPGGSVVKNQVDAIKYACKFNDLIIYNDELIRSNNVKTRSMYP